MVRIVEHCSEGLHDEETPQDRLPFIDSRSSVSSNSVRVSQFNFDSPNDRDMRKREELLSYQNHNRGLGVNKANVQTLPVISYRLRKLSESSCDRKSVTTECSDEVKSLSSGDASIFPKINNSFDAKSSKCSNISFRLAHGTIPSKRMNKGIFYSNNSGIVVSQKMILAEREHRLVEKPAISQHQIHRDLQIKEIWSSFELQGRVKKKARKGVYKSLSIPADRIGHTTKYNKMAHSPRTLADVLKPSVTEDPGSSSMCLGGKVGCSDFSNIQTVSGLTNMAWHSKLNTRLIDDLGYDIFARTERTPD